MPGGAREEAERYEGTYLLEIVLASFLVSSVFWSFYLLVVHCPLWAKPAFLTARESSR